MLTCLLDRYKHVRANIHLHIFLDKQYNMLVVSVLSNLPNGQVELNVLLHCTLSNDPILDGTAKC